MDLQLTDLLNRDPHAWLVDLDQQHGVILDEVLRGRRGAVIYPAARMGRHAAARLSAMGVELVGFGDRSPRLQGTTIDGLRVLSPDELAADHAADAFLVASTLFDSPICDDLRARGCEAVLPVAYLNLRLPDVFLSRELHGAWAAAADPANRPAIEAAYALLADEESRRVFVGKLAFYLGLEKERIEAIRTAAPIYFDPTVFELGLDEVVVDGGAFIGDTLTAFLDRCAGRFRAYFAFEPDAANLPSLEALAARDPERIVVVPAGLGRTGSVGRFLSQQGPDSRLLRDDEEGGERVSLVGLDQYFGGGLPDPTIIKMDIEAGEAEALNGAAGIIRRAEPVLAISAYHYASDLWAIPLLMARLMPTARIHLRHYTHEVDDTVCYAVPASRGLP